MLLGGLVSGPVANMYGDDYPLPILVQLANNLNATAMVELISRHNSAHSSNDGLALGHDVPR